MLGFFLALTVGSIVCVPGVFSGAPPQSQPDCRDASKDVDVWLNKSNNGIMTGGSDTLILNDFQSAMRPNILGISLPFTVYMEVSDGLITSMDQLKRISPVYMCNSSTITNTSGLFQYKDMTMTYKIMKAKFLFWEIEGKFSYKFEPVLNLWVVKNTDPLVNDCGPVKPLTLSSTGSSNYIIESDDSWKSWFLKKVLHLALVSDDNTPMLQNFLDLAWASIDCHYCKFSC